MTGTEPLAWLAFVCPCCGAEHRVGVPGGAVEATQDDRLCVPCFVAALASRGSERRRQLAKRGGE